MTYRAVLFDVDGTLINSLADIGNAMNRSLAAFSLPEWPLEDYRILVGDGARKLAERAIRDRQDLLEKVLGIYQRDYSGHNTVLSAPYDGIPDLLHALLEAGLKLVVLSNKPDADTKRMMAHYFPNVPFAAVVGQKEGVPLKPDPTGAIRIAEEIGLPPASFLYLGDTSVDMVCAKRAGMLPVGVLWGFRTEKELRESGAEMLLSHPMDLLKRICDGK